MNTEICSFLKKIMESIDQFAESLNPLQLKAFRHVTQKEHVFLTGPGGTGKSYTIKTIIEWARHNKKKIGVTSSTGTSAITVNGQTLHSFLGLRPFPNDKLPEMTKSVRGLHKFNLVKFQRIQQLEILIIDEISMISAEFFDFVSQYMFHIRHSTQTPFFPEDPKAHFGGVQIVLCGDLLQLPPVQGKYCFESKAFECLTKNSNLKMVSLIDSKRQAEDEEFVTILNDARFGEVSQNNFKRLKGLTGAHTNFGEVKPTILYSRNRNVDEYNLTEYKKITEGGAKERTYPAEFSSSPKTEEWVKTLKIESSVSLAVGAQVMLTYNLDVESGLVNGSRGMVVDFDECGPVVLFKNGDQIIIEYITVQDSNEETHKCVTADCDLPAEYADNKAPKPVRCFKHHLQGMVRVSEMWVKFMPLRLAWAITIHKSQSATLDCAVLSLADCFACGQAYTALSRVRDMQSVIIKSIHPHCFKADPKAVDFYVTNGLR